MSPVPLRALPAAPSCVDQAHQECHSSCPVLSSPFTDVETCLKASVVEGAVSAHVSPFSCINSQARKRSVSSSTVSLDFLGKRAVPGGAVTGNSAEGERRGWGNLWGAGRSGTRENPLGVQQFPWPLLWNRREEGKERCKNSRVPALCVSQAKGLAVVGIVPFLSLPHLPHGLLQPRGL